MDVETLHNNILSALPSDPIAQIHLSDPLDSCWFTDEAGFLRLDGHIYVPDLDGLHLRVLWYHHSVSSSTTYSSSKDHTKEPHTSTLSLSSSREREREREREKDMFYPATNSNLSPRACRSLIRRMLEPDPKYRRGGGAFLGGGD